MKPKDSGSHAAFSTDGRRLVYSGGNQAHFWDTQTHHPIGEPFRTEAVYAPFDPGGPRLLTILVGLAGEDVCAPKGFFRQLADRVYAAFTADPPSEEP